MVVIRVRIFSSPRTPWGFFFARTRARNWASCAWGWSGDRGLLLQAALGSVDRPQRIGLSATGPDVEVGEGVCESVGQVLDSRPLGRVMAGNHEGDPHGLCFERAVEPGLAGQEHVGIGPHRVAQEIIAG